MIRIEEKEIEILEKLQKELSMCPQWKALKQSAAIKKILEEYRQLTENSTCTFREDAVEEDLWICSKCHGEWFINDESPQYCPICGAKIVEFTNWIEQEKEAVDKYIQEYGGENE